MASSCRFSRVKGSEFELLDRCDVTNALLKLQFESLCFLQLCLELFIRKRPLKSKNQSSPSISISRKSQIITARWVCLLLLNFYFSKLFFLLPYFLVVNFFVCFFAFFPLVNWRWLYYLFLESFRFISVVRIGSLHSTLQRSNALDTSSLFFSILCFG